MKLIHVLFAEILIEIISPILPDIKDHCFYQNRGLLVVEVTGLEPAASRSRKVPNAQYIVLFSSFMCFLLQNIGPRGAL